MSLKRNVFISALGGVLVLTLGCSQKETKVDAAPVTSVAPEASTSVDPVNDLKIVYFDFNKATLTKAARADLKFDASWLKSHPEASVEVQGHCDERGSDAYNDHLGVGTRPTRFVDI